MSDKTIGLIEKYTVERTDGKLVRWCFVLEDTDPLAKAAILTYADMAEGAGYLELSTDLRKQVSGQWPRPRMEPLPDNGRRSAEDDWQAAQAGDEGTVARIAELEAAGHNMAAAIARGVRSGAPSRDCNEGACPHPWCDILNARKRWLALAHEPAAAGEPTA